MIRTSDSTALVQRNDLAEVPRPASSSPSKKNLMFAVGLVPFCFERRKGSQIAMTPALSQKQSALKPPFGIDGFIFRCHAKIFPSLDRASASRLPGRCLSTVSDQLAGRRSARTG